LESPLARQINSKGFERGLVLRFSDLFRCHRLILAKFAEKVQISGDNCTVPPKSELSSG
jgi:hypothetical protein